MSENLPDGFDPQQPDLPTLGADPDPLPPGHESQAPTTEPLTDDASEPADDDARGTPG